MTYALLDLTKALKTPGKAARQFEGLLSRMWSEQVAHRAGCGECDHGFRAAAARSLVEFGIAILSSELKSDEMSCYLRNWASVFEPLDLTPVD